MAGTIGTIGAEQPGRADHGNAVLLDPGDPTHFPPTLRAQTDPRRVFRWARRYCCVADVIDPRCLRAIVGASDAIELDELRRWANSANHDRRFPLAIVSAILFVKRRRFVDSATAKPIAYGTISEYFGRLIAALSKRPLPTSIEQAKVISYIYHITISVVLLSGHIDAYEELTRRLSSFERWMRKQVSSDQYRALNAAWLGSVGHLVVLGHILIGQKNGVFNDTKTFVPASPVANEYLLQVLMGSAETLFFTGNTDLFFEPHSSNTLDRVGGDLLDCFEICARVAAAVDPERGALLAVPDPDRAELDSYLTSVGHSGARGFVTVHCREDGFRDQTAHRARNARIADCLPALQRLVALGYTVIRIGDPSMSRLPERPGFVDYAHSPRKSQKLDVLLVAGAAFHIGSSSGMSLVPLLFGTPCLFLNWYPTTLLPWGPRTWTVLKTLTDAATGCRVHDPAVLYSVGKVPDAEVVAELGYVIGDLTPAEVEAAVAAFMETLERDDFASGGSALAAPVFRMDDSNALVRLAPRPVRAGA